MGFQDKPLQGHAQSAGQARGDNYAELSRPVRRPDYGMGPLPSYMPPHSAPGAPGVGWPYVNHGQWRELPTEGPHVGAGNSRGNPRGNPLTGPAANVNYNIPPGGSGPHFGGASANFHGGIPSTTMGPMSQNLHNAGFLPPATDSYATAKERKRKSASVKEAASVDSKALKQPKKISCTPCRTRKIKCDGVKPICGSCSKKGLTPELCIYDNSPWVSTVVKEKQLTAQIQELKDQNETLSREMQAITSAKIQLQEENVKLRAALQKSDNSDEPDSFSAESATAGDLASSFPCKEKFNVLQKFDASSGFEATVHKLVGPTSWRAALSVDKKMRYIFDQISKSVEVNMQQAQNGEVIALANRNEVVIPSKSGLLLNVIKDRDGPTEAHRELVSRICQKLPSPIAMRLHIENFFCGIACQLCPGSMLKSEILGDSKEIFGIDLLDPLLESYGQTKTYEVLDVDNELAYCKAARMLMIVKMSLLFGLNKFRHSSDAQNLTARFPFLSSSTAIKKCFASYKDSADDYNLLTITNVFLFLGKARTVPNLPAINALLLLYLYSLYGPNFSNEHFNDASSSVLGLACHMAIQLGFHKDIDLLYKDGSDELRSKLKSTRLILLGYDGRRSLVTGLPLLINESYLSSYSTDPNLSPENPSLADKEKALIAESVGLSRKIMDEISGRDNETRLNLKLQINRLAQHQKKFSLSSLSEHLRILNKDRLSEGDIYYHLRQIKNFLHIYALQQSMHLMIYLTYDCCGGVANAEHKLTYYLRTVRLSVLLLLSVVEVGKTTSKICRVYNLNMGRLYYIIPAMKECEIRALLFMLSITLKDLYHLKNHHHDNTRPKSDDSYNGLTAFHLTLEQLEAHCLREDTDSLDIIRLIFSKEHTFSTLKFLSACLESIWSCDREVTEANSEYSMGLKVTHTMFMTFVQVLQDFQLSSERETIPRISRDREDTCAECSKEETGKQKESKDCRTGSADVVLKSEAGDPPSHRSSPLVSSLSEPPIVSVKLGPVRDLTSGGHVPMPPESPPAFHFQNENDGSLERLPPNSLIPDDSEKFIGSAFSPADFLFDQVDNLLTLDSETFDLKFKNDLN
ncbi:LAMI_0D10308g1_1 [Lachancea mirantina]|uniref:LAMI_0D10308g1_1 n=1 Tax=Lachancea mirantina TaxID=1230905 RepID=A0A1G4JEB0_9SACH|nr:LAMI_0D10308g1_1 [Lachancea mirantina]